MNKMHLKHEKKVKEARGWISPEGKAKYKEYIFEREREREKKKSIFMKQTHDLIGAQSFSSSMT